MTQTTRQACVHRLPMRGPDDTSYIKQAITRETIKPDKIIAVLGKTEGNGCVNDFTRGYAVQSLKALLSSYLTDSQINTIPLIMSGGTEGGISPHWLVFQTNSGTFETDIKDDSNDASNDKALAFSSAFTRSLSASEIGRVPQSLLVKDAVEQAMKSAGIKTPSDVHFVQIKCPLITAERAVLANNDVATLDTLRSMGLSRGASALGVALALGELDSNEISDAAIGSELSMWSRCASCSAGIELMHCEVVVMGASASWAGPLRIAHCVMQDAIDAPAFASLLQASFNHSDLQHSSNHILAILAKAEASKNGTIRGNRHTMLDDSDISSTRHARGFVAGLLAGLTGLTELFVSGGAEHQGPDGGGPVAMIYSQPQKNH